VVLKVFDGILMVLGGLPLRRATLTKTFLSTAVVTLGLRDTVSTMLSVWLLHTEEDSKMSGGICVKLGVLSKTPRF
jgi:hypothetical protein